MTRKQDDKSLTWDGQKIQALRKHLRMTQTALSKKLGTRQQTISEWETGMYQPRGTSATLLTMVAEQARFEYNALKNRKKH